MNENYQFGKKNGLQFIEFSSAPARFYQIFTKYLWKNSTNSSKTISYKTRWNHRTNRSTIELEKCAITSEELDKTNTDLQQLQSKIWSKLRTCSLQLIKSLIFSYFFQNNLHHNVQNVWIYKNWTNEILKCEQSFIRFLYMLNFN